MKLYKWKTTTEMGSAFAFYGGYPCILLHKGLCLNLTIKNLGNYSLLYLDDSYITPDGREYFKFLLCDDKEYRNGKIVYIQQHLVEPLFGEQNGNTLQMGR